MSEDAPSTEKKPGEFTSRFDSQVLRSRSAEESISRIEADKEQAEFERIAAQLKSLQTVLDRRAAFISERFANARRTEFGGVGFRFVFVPADDRPRAAVFQLRARLNDSRLAILVESETEIPAIRVKERDYVTIPLHRFDLERAKSFVEAKLFDFARRYVG